MIGIANRTPAPSRCGTEAAPYSVADVTGRAGRLLERKAPDIWVSGEVSRWSRSGRGYLYMTLRDETSQLRVVGRPDLATRIPYDLPVGMRVVVHGQMSVYVPSGEMQLKAAAVRSLDERGQWQLQIERVRRVLESEGLLDPGRRRTIPRMPAVIGVVTSPQGAALQDVLAVLTRRYPLVEVVFAPTRVQGRGAEVEIARAVNSLSESGADVLIVTRGGGSLEDLWPFNSETVARAISKSPIPVISAIGHETDVTMCDLVADRRAPTPSAAAELAVPDVKEVMQRVERERELLRANTAALLRLRGQTAEQGRKDIIRRLTERLAVDRAQLRAHCIRDPVAAMDRTLSAAGRELESVGTDQIYQRLQHRVDACGKHLDEISAGRMAAIIRSMISRAESRLDRAGPSVLLQHLTALLDRSEERQAAAVAELEALAPRTVLARGWSLVTSERDEVVRHPGQVAPGETIRVTVAGGVIHARVAYTADHQEDR